MKKIVPEYSFSAEQLNSISVLAKETGLTEQITRILYARGVDTAEKIRRFMHPSEKNFLSPYLMKGMKEAVELITQARDEGRTVAVFGDYDADGVTVRVEDICFKKCFCGVRHRHGLCLKTLAHL